MLWAYFFLCYSKVCFTLSWLLSVVYLRNYSYDIGHLSGQGNIIESGFCSLLIFVASHTFTFTYKSPLMYTPTRFDNPELFIQALKGTSKISFEKDELKAEVSRIDIRNSKRETMIRYFWKQAGNWVPFSFCSSPFVNQIAADFKYQCKIFGLLT